MINDKRIDNVTTLIFGDRTTSWVIAKANDDKHYTSIVFLTKRQGQYDDIICNDVDNWLDSSIPVVSMLFRDKKSIEVLIESLTCFKENIYGKTEEEILNE